MKRFYLATTIWLCLVSFAHAQNNEAVQINKQYSKATALQQVLEKFTEKDLPGVGLAVYSESEGWWASAAGYAQLESKKPMTTANLQFLQSISKTFLAVQIMQLHEQNKIALEDAMTKYLPAKYSRVFPQAQSISIRMLLTHTSGLPEYISHPKYTERVLLHPTKAVTIDEMIQAVEGEPMQFAPASRYLYTNTNYLLLAIIADQITGDHAAHMRKNIFQPLQMLHTYYDPHRKKMDYPGLPDSYWDLLSAGRPANITEMQRTNVAPLMGDDGVIATTTDAVLFLRGLMEGKLVKPSTLDMMQQWVKNDKGNPAYGLGLIHFDLGGITAIGHGGGGLGAGCVLAYVPSKKLYFFLATNTGVVVEGLGGIKANEFKEAVLMELLK